MSKGYDLPEDDDGETIVNMDVDGMPWHDRRAYRLGSRRPSADATPDSGSGLTSSTSSGPAERHEFSDEEVKAYRFAALKASLLVALIFAVVFGLFIAFCDFVLFR